MPEQPWWYLKKRRNPSGVLGRPRSPVPLPQRRQRARKRYLARLATRGLRSVRLLLSAVAADKLRTLAATRRMKPGQLVTELLEIESNHEDKETHE